MSIRYAPINFDVYLSIVDRYKLVVGNNGMWFESSIINCIDSGYKTPVEKLLYIKRI